MSRVPGPLHEEVLARAGRYRLVQPEGAKRHDPAPLKAKEVWVEEHRYVVCRNEAHARKDAADRDAILAHLRTQLSHGDKSLVGNRSYRRFLKTQGERVTTDEAKVREEARHNGKGRCCAPTPSARPGGFPFPPYATPAGSLVPAQ